MIFPRIVRALHTLTAPGTGRRRKGKSPVIPSKPNTPPQVPADTYQPFELDMAEVAHALMTGLARDGLKIFRTDAELPQRPRTVRVTATFPTSTYEIHPLARASKRMMRPEDAEHLSPAQFRMSGTPGMRVALRPVEAPRIPPRPLTPPPVRAALSAPVLVSAGGAVSDVEDTQELYRDAGWDALFTSEEVFTAETLDMPEVPDPQQSAHLCKHCRELHNGTLFGARVWRCDGCKVISTY